MKAKKKKKKKSTADPCLPSSFSQSIRPPPSTSLQRIQGPSRVAGRILLPILQLSLPARREANETAVLYIHIIHALLIRLFFSFFLSFLLRQLGSLFFFLYIEVFFEILIIRYSVVLLCLSVIYFLLSLLFSHSFMKNFSDPLRSFFLLFSFRSGLEGKREN